MNDLRLNADERQAIVVPPAWSELDLEGLGGILLVVGAPDTGKSTFARWLLDRLAREDRPVAFLDGDVGQSSLGPPTALTLALPDGGRLRWFIGDTSPRGHMLPLVVGAGRLARRAREAGVETMVVDTTGLVDPAHGGVALKHALIDQLRPTTLFAFQRDVELEAMLAPLRPLPRPRIVQMPVSDAVQRRDMAARQSHRARAFRRYFRRATVVRLPLRGRGVFEGCSFAPSRLLALQDADGFALALGVVAGIKEARKELKVHTPLTDTEIEIVASIRLGAIGIEIDTGRDYRPGRR